MGGGAPRPPIGAKAFPRREGRAPTPSAPPIPSAAAAARVAPLSARPAWARRCPGRATATSQLAVSVGARNESGSANSPRSAPPIPMPLPLRHSADLPIGWPGPRVSPQPICSDNQVRPAVHQQTVLKNPHQSVEECAQHQPYGGRSWRSSHYYYFGHQIDDATRRS
jgi:hypothetical protein